jgi:hypothetical protein
VQLLVEALVLGFRLAFLLLLALREALQARLLGLELCAPSSAVALVLIVEWEAEQLWALVGLLPQEQPLAAAQRP